jgi:hypothetical protein
MFANLRPAFGITLVFFILLGLAYPLAETGIGQAFFSPSWCCPRTDRKTGRSTPWTAAPTTT